MSRDCAGRRTRIAPSRVWLAAVVAAAMAATAPGMNALRAASDPLEVGFQTPPNESDHLGGLFAARGAVRLKVW